MAEDLPETGQTSSGHRGGRGSRRDWTLGATSVLAFVAVTGCLIQLDASAFRRSLEAQLVRAADAATARVDADLRSRSRELQERLLGLETAGDRTRSIVAEVEAIRGRREFSRLRLAGPNGAIINPLNARESRPGRSRPRYEGPLRRAGMFDSPGLEIHHLPGSHGALVLVGLGPAGLVVGHHWPRRTLYESVDAVAAEDLADGVTFAVLDAAGELAHSTGRPDPPPLHRASMDLVVFPGWRLAAFHEPESLEVLTEKRLRRAALLALLAFALVAALVVGFRRRPRKSDRAAGATGGRGAPALQRIGETVVHLDRFELERGGSVMPLSVREAELLAMLLESRGKIVRREDLLERVWGYAADVESRTLDTFIYRLRQKIERDPAHAEHLITVRGVGYKLSAG